MREHQTITNSLIFQVIVVSWETWQQNRKWWTFYTKFSREAQLSQLFQCQPEETAGARVVLPRPFWRSLQQRRRLREAGNGGTHCWPRSVWSTTSGGEAGLKTETQTLSLTTGNTPTRWFTFTLTWTVTAAHQKRGEAAGEAAICSREGETCHSIYWEFKKWLQTITIQVVSSPSVFCLFFSIVKSAEVLQERKYSFRWALP